MSNREKLQKIISDDYSKEKNYNEILEFIGDKKMNKKNNIWKWSLVPICLILIIGGFFFIRNQNNSNEFDPPIEYVDKEKNIKLNINSLNKIGVSRFDADIKTIPTSGLNMKWPEILKDGIAIPKSLDKTEAYSVYTRKEKNGEFDTLNCYVYNYFNENHEKNIRLAFSNTNEPIRDYFFSEDGGIDTIINDVKLKIYSYNTIYFVRFTYKDYYFDIETDNLTEQELSDLLSSIIK